MSALRKGVTSVFSSIMPPGMRGISEQVNYYKQRALSLPVLMDLNEFRQWRREKLDAIEPKQQVFFELQNQIRQIVVQHNDLINDKLNETEHNIVRREEYEAYKKQMIKSYNQQTAPIRAQMNALQEEINPIRNELERYEMVEEYIDLLELVYTGKGFPDFPKIPSNIQTDRSWRTFYYLRDIVEPRTYLLAEPYVFTWERTNS